MRLNIYLSCAIFLAVISVAFCDTVPKWIWYPEKFQDHSIRYFRKTITLDEDIERALFTLACDDGGTFFVNGHVPVPGNIWLRTARYDLTKFMKKGKNVLAFKISNGVWIAGLICSGEIFLKSGKVIKVSSDGSWLTSTKASSGWTGTDFKDNSWVKAKVVGPLNMPPWGKLIDCKPFLDKGDEKFVAIPLKNKGRLMIDDFSDVSSWMGWPKRGHKPGNRVIPFQLGMGSAPCKERDDGYSGAIDYAFVSPDGQLRFEKNAVYKNAAVAEAIEFDANPQGYESSLVFTLSDRRNKPLFTTAPVKLSGSKWRRYRLKLNPDTVKNYKDIIFPVSIRSLCFNGVKPGEGRVLIDDLAYVVDISKHQKKFDIHPIYTKLAFGPGDPVRLGFRIRNGFSHKTDCDIKLNIYDHNNKNVFSGKQKLAIPGFGLSRAWFEAGSYDKKGPYRIELSAENGKDKNTFSGWFGVFVPNGKRINKSPMWFGIEDQEIRNFQYELMLHKDWMKLLGVDIARGGTLGSAIDTIRGEKDSFDQFKKMWQPYFDAGIDIFMSYAGSLPSWTFSQAAKKRPKWWMSVSADPKLLKEHIANIGRFIAANPQIKYFGWLNEPELEFFSGTTDEYLESLRLIYPVLKQTAPNLKVLTGGVTGGSHYRAKKNFSKRLYQECGDSYDIAAFHCHGIIEDYKVTMKRIENWLKEKQIDKPICNTEAGFRSYYGGPQPFYTQATQLVKKIIFSKSRNAEFYSWFMLHDYGDKFINSDDSFGLVTVDNQPKPSFLAYNELIRQMANTRPTGENTQLDARLETYKFSNKEKDVFACWPKRSGEEFNFCLKSDRPVTFVDMFGNEKHLKPSFGVVYVNSDKYPFYIYADAGSISVLKPLINVTGNNVFVPGQKSRLAVEFMNGYSRLINFSAKSKQQQESGVIAPKGKYKFFLNLDIPLKAAPGVYNVSMAVEMMTTDGVVVFDNRVPLAYSIALPVVEKGATPYPITLNKVDYVKELFFDVNTPCWSGPEDLSADITMTWDNKNLNVKAVVRDQDYSHPNSGAMIWRNDCIQLAFANDKLVNSEITASLDKQGKAVVWCHISPDKQLVGKWDIPVSVERKGDKITYKLAIPFAKLKITPDKDTLFKMSILLNDNDHGKRLRVMEWNGGIEGGKDPEAFGWVKLK